MMEKVLAPNYYDRFSCLGGKCGYTCCQEWTVHISKRDYKNLMKRSMPATIKEQLRSFARRTDDEDDNHYAQIKMNDERKCAFLTKEGFCSLQLECGAEVLTKTCKVYPRQSQIVSETKELNVRLSCEGTVGILTELTEGVQFDIVEKNENDIPGGGGYYFHTERRLENPLMEHYWDIKALGIGILQDRDLTLIQRILYLGFVIKRLIEHEEGGRLAEVAGMLDALMKQESSTAISESLDKLPVNPQLSAGAQITFANLKGIDGYVKLFYEAIEKIGELNGDDATIHSDVYIEARARYKAFCEKYPHVMENIVVTLFHELAMPFGGIHFGVHKEELRIDIWRNYLYFCWQISNLQFILGALVTPETELSEVARIVAIVSRQSPNSSESSRALVEQMEKAGFDTMDKLSILLKG